jgi:uncharacterized membrane protein YkvA (DUF1232 family)
MPMILTGVLALLVGAILAFAVPGHVGDVGVGTLGALVMISGSVILITGLLQLRRGARRPVVRRVGSRIVTSYQDRAYRTSKGKIFAMVIAVIYILSPIDFIPDFLLPFGVIDDATAFAWLVFAIGQELNRRRGPAI